MNRPSPSRNEEGSIILVVLVILVATALVVTTVALTERGLRSSRRAGDSANALQVADAGVNAAVQRASVLSAMASPPATDTVGPVTVGAGTYTYVLTRDPNPDQPVWHIVSTGTDNAGLRRRIRADAVLRTPQSLALFVSSNLKMRAGSTVDSYLNSVSTCTGKGYVGTNDAANFTLTSGTAVSGNCRGVTWGYPYDGCISYADSSPADFRTGPGGANCPPPPYSDKATPAFVIDPVYPLAGSPTAQASPVAGACTAANPIQARSAPYFWTSVSLHNGCRILPDTSVSPPSYKVRIVTTGDVDLGSGSGGGGLVINAPVAAACVGPGDVRYCPRWPSNLEISVVSTEPRLVNINNNLLEFWGVINAPSAKLTSCSGCPQSVVYGAMALNEADAPTQLAVHYDESLRRPTTGEFELRNWVQEGV